MVSVIGVIVGIIGFLATLLSHYNVGRIQKQNVNVKLFKERYDVYLLLRKWYNFTPRLLEENEMGHLDVLFDWGDPEMVRLVGAFSELKKKNLSNFNGEEMVDAQNRLISLKNYLQTTAQKEQHRINTVMFLYSDTKFTGIEKFTDAFFNVAKNILGKDETSEAGMLKLKATFEELNWNEVFDAMTKQLYALKKLL